VTGQLELAVLPVASRADMAAVRRETWLRRVLAAARAVEARVGPWWGCSEVAAYLGRPLSKAAPAVMLLTRRGALTRGEVGVDARGRMVYAWALRRYDGDPWRDLELERLFEMLDRANIGA